MYPNETPLPVHGTIGDGAGTTVQPVLPVPGPKITFVFRPGGVQKENVFTDFFTLSDSLQRTHGLKILEFDDSITSPIVLPPGTFPMHMVSWTGSAPKAKGVNHVHVQVPDDCFLPGLRMISGQIAVQCTATRTSPVADFLNGARLIQLGKRLDDGFPFLWCTGGKPFFEIGNLPFGLGFDDLPEAEEGALFFQPQSPTCNIIVHGHWGEPLDRDEMTTPPAHVESGKVIFILFGQIGENMIDAEETSSVFLDWMGGFEAANQATIRGEFIIRNPGSRPRNRIQPQSRKAGIAPVPAQSKIDVALLQTGDVLVFNPLGNDIMQMLPAIIGSFKSKGRSMSTLGHQMIVKNVSTNRNVNVKANESDTIDLDPETTSRGISIGPGESCIFQSDGVNNWYVVSFSQKSVLA